MTTILSNFVTRKLCENEGCMEFKLLDQIIEKTFTVDQGILHDVLCNDGKFAIKEGNEKASGLVMSPDSVIVAKTTLRVCRSLPGKCLQCDELHLCRYFVCGKCKFGDECKNGHTVNVPHNMTQLNGVGLQELKEEELFQLLLQNDPHLLPEVCSHYNEGAGEHGSCKFNTTCTNLHLCLHFLQGDCKFGSACKRDHTLNGQADKILTGRGFDLENIQNLLTIYRNKFIILGHIPTAITAPASAALPVVRERTAIASSGSSISEAEHLQRGASGSSSSSSSSVVDVPSHWDRSPGSLPDFSYKLVPLSSSMKEYQMVEKLFMRTMSSSTIHSIHRNQNTSLWRDFHWQKEQMQARNGGKAVDERYLFHGTDESVVKAICEQNLDWRDSGVNGTLYGIGSYFARDAKYSNAYAKSRTSRKKMFAALVLVGEFVKGAGSYRKPPPKSAGSGSSSSRYDSCVDNVANPSIFVVFEKQQIYPEYVIDYS